MNQYNQKLVKAGPEESNIRDAKAAAEAGDTIGICFGCNRRVKYGTGWVLKPCLGASRLFHGTCG